MKPKVIKIKTQPATEPVTLAELKTFLRIDSTLEDDFLNSLITASRLAIEKYCQIAFINTTFQGYYDGFPPIFTLPKGKIQSIVSISYYDTDEILQTIDLSNIDQDLESEPAILRVKDDFTWPDTYDKQNSVFVEYIAGFGAAASDVPEPLKVSIKLNAGAVYDGGRVDRRAGNSLPKASELYAQPYAVMEF